MSVKGSCRLPWTDGKRIRATKEKYSTHCLNPDKTCDYCSCLEVDDGKAPAKLEIDPEGCNKPKDSDKCPKLCKGDDDVHYADDTWDCWHADWK